MGVKGLHGFISSQPEELKIWEKISIQDEIDKFKKETGKRPKIVIDLKEMIHFNTGSKQIALGGQYFLLTKYLDNFLNRLKNCGIEMIFFYRVHAFLDDVKIFIPYAEAHYIASLNVLNDLTESNNNRGKLHDHIRLPITFEYNALRLAKQYGDVKLNYFRNNQEIAKYLKENENDILSIFSNDTDFIIFDGKYQYWQVNDLNMKDMTAIHVNRSEVYKQLNLNCDQMYLLSALSYGHILSFGVMKHFYENVIYSSIPKSRFLRLVDYVKQQKINSEERNLQKKFNLMKICSEVFGENFTEHEMNAIENGIRQYSIDFEISIGPTSSIVKLLKEKNFFMYQLVNDEIYLITDFLYIDYELENSRSYAELVLPLIRRMQGILYGTKPNRPKSRFVCMKHAHNEPFKVTNEVIEYPSSTAEVFDLIFATRERKHDNLRWFLLGWMFKFDEKFMKILRDLSDKKFCGVLLTIRYLLQNRAITEDEADAIFLTEFFVKKLYGKQPKFQFVNKVQARRIRIAHLYVKMYRWICYAMEVCGFYNLADLITFDASYFHVVMEQFDSNMKEANMKPFQTQYVALLSYKQFS